MKHFLIVYRRSAGKIVSLDDLSQLDPASAMEKRFDVERSYRKDPDVEVVLLSAASRSALMRTHSRYFRTSGELATDLAKAAS